MQPTTETLPEALVLLAWRNGKRLPIASVGIQTGCALLLELSLRGRIRITDSVELLRPEPTRHEALDEALHEIVSAPRATTLSWIRNLSILAEAGAMRRLEAAGALPSELLPVGVERRTQLEAQLRAVLFGGAAPDARVLYLLGIQHAFSSEKALWNDEAAQASTRSEQLLRHELLAALIGEENAQSLASIVAAAKLIVNS